MRLIELSDAAYVHGLRTNPVYNQYLSTVDGTVLDQRRWIETYKHREAMGQELYFIIERRDGTPCGTVRLYDINAECFTWGSWILDHNKPHKAALESAFLIYKSAFDLLKLSEARFDVRRDNENTLAFHRRFGATEIHADEQDVFFVYPNTRFAADQGSYLAILECENPA